MNSNIVLCGYGVDPEGGAAVQRLIYQLAYRAREDGDTAVIVGMRPSADVAARGLMDGFENYRYFVPRPDSAWYFLYPLLAAVGAYRSVRRAARKHRIDVINHHNPISALFCYVLPLFSIRQVFTFHAPRAYEFLARKREAPRAIVVAAFVLLRITEYIVYSRAKEIIVHSAYMASELKRYKEFRGRIRMVYPGVDTEHFSVGRTRQLLRRELELPLDRHVLLSVRRLDSRMGLENMITAMLEVTRRYPGALLVIGGKGALRPTLSRLIEAHGLEQSVRLVGYIPEDLLPSYYGAADLFVLPTEAYEGFGYVILESFSCGTPVTGTPVGAIPEVLKIFDSRLIMAGHDSDAIAEKILELLACPLDDRARRRYRQQIEEQFDWKVRAREFLDLLLAKWPASEGDKPRDPHGNSR